MSEKVTQRIIMYFYQHVRLDPPLQKHLLKQFLPF